QQAQALADYFEALALPEQLERRATELEDLGMAQEAAEYAQLWDIVTGALQQCVAILADTEMGQEDFGALFALVLSAYDVGSIPLSLDKVTAGDMERVRSRHVKHLLVLGCDSETLPRSEVPGGLFSDRDREALNAVGLELGDTAEGRLRREFALIYNCLTLPSDSLCLSYCSAGGESGQSATSFVLRRCADIFSLPLEPVDLSACRSWATGPARELAAMAGRETAGELHRAARRWFEARGGGETLRRLEIAAKLGRGSLSRRAVRALYGPRPRLSASKVEKLNDCAFAFFMRYGLKARPRQPAGFQAPEKGSFLHDILEHVARDVQARGGFAAVERSEVEALCDAHVARYIHEKLFDFRQKNARFVYLFRRLIREVRAIVGDMAEELRRSDFVPLDFELNFGDRSAFPPLELGEGEDCLVLTGVADRVDGWSHDGKLYLRVVDYKTGNKKFSLSDVWYGMGLQMLLYLFALEREGAARYGSEIVPAGVLYVPARDTLLQSGSRLTPEKILEEKAKQLHRSGLLLNDPAVLEAMEHGDKPRYLPVKFNRLDEGSLASAERLGILSRHVDKTLRALAASLQRGSIEADPWFRSQLDNACRYCDWAEACHFDESRDKRRNLVSMRTEEVWQKLEEGSAEHGL
ncbi:MAG: PD-(D/E)XK nuclease family protein, partial [Oscillospiraceae bacterium]|nr:PD-(D/E)XK nuclease family protein [Oscillospiraceae bacterium]